MKNEIEILDGILERLYEGRIVQANVLFELMEVPLKERRQITPLKLNQQFEYYAYIINKHCGDMVRNGYYYQLVKDYRTSYYYQEGGFKKNFTPDDV